MKEITTDDIKQAEDKFQLIRQILQGEARFKVQEKEFREVEKTDDLPW